MLKRPMIFLLIVAFGLSSISCFIIIPLNISLSNNVLYAGTILPLILDFISTLFELLIFWSAFSVVIYSIYRDGLAHSKKYLFIYVGSIIYKYAANYLMSSLREKIIDLFDLMYVGIYILIEAVIAFIIIFETVKIINNNLNTAKRHRIVCFPFAKLFDLNNPVQKSAFTAALTLTVAKVFSRIIYDIAIGFPESLKDAMWMLAYYSADIIAGLIGYITIIWFLMLLNQSDKKPAGADNQ